MRRIINSHTTLTHPSSNCIYAGLIVLSIFAWWANWHAVDLVIAYRGYSPIIYVYKTFDPVNFAKDFPGGFENFGKSAFMHIYTVAYKYFNISPESLLPVVACLQIIVLAGSIYLLSRTLFPDANPVVHFLVLTLAIASYARDMDFARYAKPTGDLALFLYYDITDALRVLAIVTLLRGRLISTALLLAAAVIVYPTLGLLGAIFILAMQVVKVKEINAPRALAGTVVFFIITCTWLFATFQSGDFSGFKMPEETWFDFSMLGSVHLYPVDNGIFTFKHDERFIQFLSFALLFSFYISKFKPLRDMDRKILAGVFAMAILSISGIVISALKPSPTLVKLSLHRANDLIILVGLIYIVEGLWSEIEAGSIWRKSIAASILLSPFILKPGFPILYTIALLTPAYVAVFSNKNNAKNWIITAATAGVITLIVIYIASGMLRFKASDAYTGGSYLLLVLLVISVLFVILKKWSNHQYAKLLIMVIIIVSAILWLKENRMLHGGANKWSDEELSVAQSYKEAQLWAQTGTPEDALFMTDPSLGYSWRDYSRRSSFGTLREWLFSGWLYESNFKIYQEGMKRFNEFSINVNDYFNNKPPVSGWHKLRKKVKERYYSFDDDWRMDLARRYGIDYFVLIKSEMTRPSAMPVAYENKHFVVLSAASSQNVDSAAWKILQ